MAEEVARSSTVAPEYLILYSCSGKKEADPELDCGSVARAAPGYLILHSCTWLKGAGPELDCGGVASASTTAPGYQSVYSFTWQKGGGSGAGLWRCGQSRPEGTSVWCVLLYLAKRRRIRIVEVWPEPAQLHQGIKMCTALPGKKEADPELDCGGVAIAGTAAPGCQCVVSGVYCCCFSQW